MSRKFLVLWKGGYFGFGEGGGKCRFYFYGREDFSDRRVLRRFFNSKCFLKGFLEGACKGFSVNIRFLEGFLEGSVS